MREEEEEEEPKRHTHHAERLVDPKVLAKKTVTDFGYPRACRFRKCQKINQLFQNVICTS
jgi:hypothetical protein